MHKQRIKKEADNSFSQPLWWSQQGMILRPPDYESGATNQLSYGTFFLLLFGDFRVGLRILSQSLP